MTDVGEPFHLAVPQASVLEFRDVIGTLTDPDAHDGITSDAFTSRPDAARVRLLEQADRNGLEHGRVASARATLMRRLGYDCWVAQGGDRARASPRDPARWRLRASSASISTWYETMTLNDEIATFFAEYVDAFARNDALSRLWDTVGLFPSPTGKFAMERQALRDHCVTLMDFYLWHDIVRPEGRLLSATAIFPIVAQARLSYRMRGESDEFIAEWQHVYILRRSERWRVSLTIADDEVTAWTAKGANTALGVWELHPLAA